MADTKIFKIQINGITESINAVDALNRQLQTLESRIKALEKSNVKVGTTSSSSSGSKSSSSLSEEEKLAKQIEQTDAKRVAYSKEIYQNYLAAKDVLAETVNDQKAIAAQERLQANNYSNTMQGLKDRLKDVQALRNVTDMASDDFKNLTSEANKLVGELKELEEAAGSFGRNVGNYKSATSELSKYKIEVGGTVREFNTAKEAAKVFTNELLNLPKGAKGAEELHAALLKVKSDIADLNRSSSVMDNLLDTMESFTAIANVGQGLRGLFGVNDEEMQKSIKNLVALQNILKGFETINKQMKSGDGIGGFLKPFNTQIDVAIAKLVTLQSTMKATTVSAKALSVGIKAATLALKAFKAALSFGISIAIDLVLEKVLELIEKFKEGNKELEKMNKVQEEGAKAYAEAAAKIALYKQKLESFNGTKKQEKKLVEEFNKELGASLGTYKSIDEVQKALIDKSAAYCEALRNEAEAQALLNLYTEAFVNLQKVKIANAAGENDAWWRTKAGDAEHRKELEDAAQKDADTYWNAYLEKSKQAQQHNKENGLFDYSTQVDKDGKKVAETVKKVEENISKLRIEAMRDGFAKQLAQLKLEREKRIDEVRKTGIKVAEQKALIDKIYDRKEIELQVEHYNELLQLQEKFEQDRKRIQDESRKRSLEDSRFMNERNLQDQTKTTSNSLASGKTFYLDYSTVSSSFSEKDLARYGEIVNKLKALNKLLLEAVYNSENFKKNNNLTTKELKENTEKWIALYKEYADELVELEKKNPGIGAQVIETESKNLTDAYRQRIKARTDYYEAILDLAEKYAAKEKEINQDVIDTEQADLEKAEEKRYRKSVGKFEGTQIEGLLNGYNAEMQSGRLNGMTTDEIEKYFSKYRQALDNWLEDLRDKLKKGEITVEEYNEKVNNEQLKAYAEGKQSFVDYMDNLQNELETHENAMLTIKANAEEKSKNNEKKYQEAVISANRDYYSEMSDEVDRFISAISNKLYSMEKFNKAGFLDIKKIKKEIQDAKAAIQSAMNDINELRNKAFQEWQSGNLSFIDYQALTDNLNSSMNAIRAFANEVEEEEKSLLQKQAQLIASYASQLGSGLSSLIGAIGDYTDQQFENTINDIEKDLDKYKELLDKQKEITEQHKSEVDSIEDELSTARGDRRQRLIDQLNAEMAAQRASLAEEKRIEKEEKKLKDKKDREEKNRFDAQKKQQRAQAVINGAVAFMNALAQQPIWLGIAMAAMTAIMTAAQIATIDSQKYADGGVIEGKSHSQGGVKVLGGRAEVEGQEFITNKRTTAQNTDLLYYINSKKKRLDLGDFIEFYGGESVRKNISSITRSKYADGGQLPTLRGDIDVNSRLVGALEDYSNRPQVVSVVEIVDKMSTVRETQVMAGLDPTF